MTQQKVTSVSKEVLQDQAPVANGGKFGLNDRSSIYNCGITIRKINQNIIINDEINT